MKRTLLIISFIILVFIGTTMTVSYSLINSDDYLKSFNIISVSNVSTKFNINFERVKGAKDYEIVFYNEDDSIFYKENTTNNNMIIDLDNIENNKRYKLMIYAYNDSGKYITVNNPYTFTYLEPTFNPKNTLTFTDNKDYELLIDGNLLKKNYYLEISFENKVIKKEIIKENTYTINKELFTGKKGIFNIKLYDQNTVISKFNIYNNMSPISNITIDSPKTNESLDYDDVNLTFTGGDNATSYSLVIFKGETLIKKTNINKNNVIISSSFFNKGENYTFKVYAYYNDIDSYTKSREVSFKIKDKDTLKPAYISNNYLFNNGKITLNNPNDTGKIYYTINGDDPSINGLEYKEPFNINENAVIKTIVIDDNNTKNNSKINSFDINIAKKDKYKIYLNLNNNDLNKTLLNNIKDSLIEQLSKYNVEIITNESNNINTNINEAKSKMVDLYLSLKTNTSSNHELNGYSIWINNDSSSSYSLGNLFNSNLKKAYYENASKGLKYTFDSLDELKNNIPYSILINIGYIDNDTDLKYLTDNYKNISNGISKTIIEYFGLF